MIVIFGMIAVYAYAFVFLGAFLVALLTFLAIVGGIVGIALIVGKVIHRND